MLPALLEWCAGLDVHKKIVVVTLIKGGKEGDRKTVREYQTFTRKLAQMASWLKDEGVQQEEALEAASLPVMVVNAMHVKKVPGRKTDVSDSEWLAELARCGLLKGSYVPNKDLRETRLLTRYRMDGPEPSQRKNRLHKVLDDCGIRLGSQRH